MASPMANEADVIAEVGRFLLTYANGSISAEAAKAKAYAYWVALEDLPLWALKAAIKRWHRGEIRVEVNYAWPQPAMLRAATLEVIDLALKKRSMLNIVLQADSAPLPEIFSEEHRKSMLQKIAGLFSGISKPISPP